MRTSIWPLRNACKQVLFLGTFPDFFNSISTIFRKFSTF
jgi:hypothetical protein